MEKRKAGFENRRNPRIDTRKYYVQLLQVGLIATLVIFIILFRIEIRSDSETVFEFDVQEIVEMEEIVITKQTVTVPPPPRPPVPVKVPDYEIIDEIDIDIDAELDIGSYLTHQLPPPKPPQDEESEMGEDEFYVIVEQMPELIGGLSSIQNKIVYPDIAKRANVQGRVIIQFVVNERGEVENPKVIRAIGAGCDEEALRVVSQARFIPGHQRGVPVRVQYTIPVVFMLKDA